MSILSLDLLQLSSSRCQHSTEEKCRQSPPNLSTVEATVKPMLIVLLKRSNF